MAKEVIIELKAKTDNIEREVEGINKEIKTLKDNIGFKPDNYIFTLSYGGKHDNLIKDLNIKSATIVDSENDTELPIDTNEFLALTSNKDFALVKHGTQPKK